MKVLGISSSPRENSNSDALLRQALSGASSTGAEAEYLRLNKFNLAPCRACGGCYATGRCVIEDDFQILLPKMMEAQRLILASPVYFMNVCSQAKILIDRCECLWASKYLLKKRANQEGNKQRLGMVIATGATKGKKIFDGIRLTMKYFFDAIDTEYYANLFISSVEEAGKVAENKFAMDEAFLLGAGLGNEQGKIIDKVIEYESANG
jgi:multimeric flavodoxin WrbA